MSVVKRAKEINQKIRESEIFPRIRDAERAMFENEEKFLKRRELKKKKKEKLLKQQQLGIKHHVSDPNHLPIIHSKKKKSTSTPQLDYFNGFVLNKDPRCSKYMPFNEVFFPKLFNPEVDGPNPHSIDMLWMLGFQHEALHQDAVVNVKKEFKS